MNELTRRKFIIHASLATGFAVAVTPSCAQAVITTSATNLVAGAVNIPTTDGQIPAYRAMPSTGKNFPIILVVSEIFGVHEHIQDVCRRLAKLGYLAIAPELFAREGGVTQLSNTDQILKVVAQVPDSQAISDLDATRDWAVKSSQGNINKLGITGFCWGGRIVWLYASHNPHVKAGVAWYGKLVGQPNALKPTNPVDIASTLKVPILGLYGGQDQSIPQDSVQQMRDRLHSSPSKSQIIVYPDASHAFFADYRPSYHEKEAQDGWHRLQVWFKQHGV
jgi:carboxymethylenebutenolidase